MGWRTTLENGKCMIKDSTNACVKFNGELDFAMMLYVAPAEHVLGSDFDTAAVEILDTQEQFFSGVTKWEYVKKLHDYSHCHTIS